MNPVTETTLRFTGDWPLVAVLLAALGLSGLMLWLYRREIRLHPSRMAWLPATLRALVVFILVLALAGPVLRHITTYRQLGRVIIAVDASASMKLEDTPITTELSGTRQPAVRTGGEPSRFERAEHLLFGGATPLLKKLIETQDVELAILRGPAVQRAWWHRQNGRDVSGEMPRAFPVQADAASTSLDQSLREALGPMSPGTALVVLTDGQHNSAGSPEEFAAGLREARIPIFTVGFGTEVPPPDLSIIDVTAPESVFGEEQLQGRLTIRDSMPPGIPAVVRIQNNGKTLWEQTFTTDGKGERRFDFSFPVRDLPAAAAGEQDKTLRLLAVQVAATGDQAALEKTRSNNARELAVHLLEKKRRLLVLDGRPRWETRYIHNHFDRDDRWEVTVAFDNFSKNPADSPVQQKFPRTRDDLFGFDLVIVGDLAPSRLKAEHVEWLAEFAERRGGGVVFIDGARGGLSEWTRIKSGSLLPVWFAAPPATPPKEEYVWQIEQEGERFDALRLSDSPSANTALWPTLPAAHWRSLARPEPGSITLASLKSPSKETSPAIVFRPFGAGAVLYLASDELWRWRYQVADLHHQRLWMQIAAWIAAPPFQAEAGRISLGTDRLRYAHGEQAEIRVRLRDDQGGMVLNGEPRAFLIHQGVEVASLALEPDPTHAGVYRALTPPLKPGAHEIDVAERPLDPRSGVRLSLRVDDIGNQEWATLTMNRPLLEAMAANSGGRFLREEQAASELPSLLQAVDRKQTVTRETILWSSWWWFGAAVLLLTTEWLLRKRLKLI